ncbi:LamG-like jellyroll fold domain-containing protein [Variovorax sp. PAMC26660]|uniref:LamG-like jellyroll fold domain-containing protein n=1 Tax=Variovorax sp. PAMC26660 TaxID=2762322 RepID=UPI0021C36F42|nr:LamG-like jellyroll fold domain-containing protein [Variovorax sp. PAMC26660]
MIRGMTARCGFAGGSVAVLLALSACGGGGGNGPYFPPGGVPPTGGTGNSAPTVNQGKSGPKALVVEVDGLTHAALRDAIAQKKATALQAFQIAPAWTGGANGTISEQRTSDNPGSATLLTGSWVQRHGVRWDTSDQRIDAKVAPSIFAIAKQNTAAGYKTAAVTANPRYSSLLGNEPGTVDAAVDCAGSDACVTERTSQLIDSGQDLIVAQYGAPAIAATASGLKSDAYQRAVTDTSAAVGQLLARIAQRTANDAKEDWLVIVTTGHGLDAFGGSTGLQTIDGKTIFIASNKTLAGLPGAGLAAPADNSLLQLAAATDIAPTVLRHLGALPAAADYRFNGQALQAATSLRGLSAKTGADKGSIELSWTLTGATTAPALVLRDGKLVATLPAGTAAHTDPIVAASDGIYTYLYTVVAGETSVALTAQIAYVKPPAPELPVPLAATLKNGLLNYYPLDTLPGVDAKNASTLAPWAADANGGTVVDDGFKPPYKVKALRVDSTVKNASGMAGYRLVQNNDVTTNPAVTTFTIGFWMRTDNTCSQGVSNGATVIGNKNYTSGGNAGLAIGLFGSCEIRFNVGTGSARADSNGYSLSAGQWAYVAVVIDKTALTMKGYVLDPVNGIQANSTAITSALVDKLGGLGNGLGLNEDGTGLYYQRETTSPRGAMDFNDFAIWNRALTNDELTSIFKSGQPLLTLLFP